MSIRASTEEKEPPPLPNPSTLKPSTYALKDLDKVKQKRYEMKTIELNSSILKARKEERLEKFMTIQHEKRLVESMSSIKNDVEYKHIQLISSGQQNASEDTNSTQIRLINLEKDEEASYQEDVESVMRRYRKVWRYLFYKYSGKRSEVGGGEEKAHMGEVWRMLKDYEFNALKKE